MNRYRRMLRDMYRTRGQQLLQAAVREQGMTRAVEELARIVPDISDQYNTPSSQLRTPAMLDKVRAMHAFQITLVRETLATLGRPDAPLTVVDLGDSSGNHLRYLLADRPQLRTVSVNLDPAAVVKITAKGLRAIQARAEDLAAYDVHPDLLMCFQMLEHVLDPIGFLKRLGDGPACRCLLLTVPLLAQSRVALNFTRQSDAPREKVPAEDVHVYELSPDDWQAIFRFAGWRVIREQRYYQYPRRALLRRLWREVLRAGDYEGFVGFVLEPDGRYRDAYLHWT